MKRIVIACSVLAFVCAGAGRAAGQTSVKGVGCMGPHPGKANHWSVRCDGQAACDAALAEHNRREHGGQPASSSGYERPRTPSQAIAFALTGGAAAGAIGGSFVTSLAGNNQWANGALGGGGATTVLAAAANANKINPVAALVLGAGGGAATGTAWARYQAEQGKADTTKRDTALGAAAGAAVVMTGYVLGKSAGGSKNRAPRFPGARGSVSMIASARFVGVAVRW